MCMFGVGDGQSKYDEISLYEAGRYISSNEAFWRLFSFPIHERYPAVLQLQVHLENGQQTCFREDGTGLNNLLTNPPNTTLTAFFKLCQEDEFARALLYTEVPHYFTWTAKKTFQRRKKGKEVEGHLGVFWDPMLGRVYTVDPKRREAYYLRILLHHVRGPTSFESIRTVEGTLCATYHEACLLLGLLQDDNHWDNTMADAATTMMPRQMRSLFAVLLSMCEMSNPVQVWEKYRDSLSEDFLHQVCC